MTRITAGAPLLIDMRLPDTEAERRSAALEAELEQARGESCAACECGVPVRDGQHREETGIEGAEFYVYPCKAMPAKSHEAKR